MVVEHNGGTLGAAGSVSWNFERRALFEVAAPAAKEEAVLEAALAAEADDCTAIEGGFEITSDPSRFGQVKEALTAAGFKPGKSAISWLAKSTVRAADEQVAGLVTMLSELDDLDDVQSTATNLEWTEQALAAAERV